MFTLSRMGANPLHSSTSDRVTVATHYPTLIGLEAIAQIVAGPNLFLM